MNMDEKNVTGEGVKGINIREKNVLGMRMR